MKKSILFRLTKIILIALAVSILLILLIPTKSHLITRLALMGFEKKFQNKIEFGSSYIWLMGKISIEDVSATDKSGRFYSSRRLDIKYNFFDLLFGNREIFLTLKKPKFYRNISILDSVASMLVISKMPDLEFEEIKCSLRLGKNLLYIKNAYAYNDLMRIKGSGSIDNAGKLDCDINFSFYKEITDKVPKAIRAIILQDEEEGWMRISFKARGNYKTPSLHITGNRLEMNIMKGIFGND